MTAVDLRRPTTRGGAPRQGPASLRSPRKFRERNLQVIAVVTAALLAVAVFVSLDFGNLPLINGTSTYRADFANAGGLVKGDITTVAGVRVGKVTALRLDGGMVQVTFTVSRGVRLGESTAAAMKVLTPIGQEFLALQPAGPGRLSQPIPVGRTTIPLTLVGDLSTLTKIGQQTNISQLANSFRATSGTLAPIAKSTVTSALDGLSRLSSILAGRQQQLATLVTSADSVAGVLATNTGALTQLVDQGDLLLKVLEARRAAIRSLLQTSSALGAQITGLFGGNRPQLTSLVDHLDTVSAILAKDGHDLGAAIPVLQAFSRYSANATGSGPYADFTLPTLLLPDNVIAQCAAMKLPDPLAGCRL